jgi:hypothetical protein
VRRRGRGREFGGREGEEREGEEREVGREPAPQHLPVVVVVEGCCFHAG